MTRGSATDVVLATINAKYIHTAFGLRYLYANLGDALQARTCLVEFNVKERPIDMCETILAKNPQVVGLGVYIWNAAQTLAVVTLLKALRPHVLIVLGGPEVSFECEEQALVRCADHVITGEGEVSFARLCAKLLAGERPKDKIIAGVLPDVASLALPYALYSPEDIAHRVMYVEASRGCPFRCEFCLSSLDARVRRFALPAFLDAMQDLIDRGGRHFKFIDRTFNLQRETSQAILEFFLARLRPGMSLHFEMIPDRLPETLRTLIAQFPPGVLQFEIGVQSLNPAVEARVSRRQDHAKLADNLRFLRDETGVHVHADLIAGLPGETLESFAAGFDALHALRPHEIQLGILKRLRGTPIVRHTGDFAMVYSPEPPYELLQNDTLDFATMQRLKRMARYWDLVVNSGRFGRTAPLVWGDGSVFWGFLRLSDWLFAGTGQTHALALDRLGELLLTYLGGTNAAAGEAARAALMQDYRCHGEARLPRFLQALPSGTRAKKEAHRPQRQGRHWAG